MIDTPKPAAVESKIPGYMGYVPQYKFEHGRSFGRQTAMISQRLPNYGEASKYEKAYISPKVGEGKITSSSKKVFQDEIPRDRIPISTGNNRYVRSTIPGYCGDIPRMLHKYGGTFTQLADECIDEFVTDYMKHAEEEAKLDEQMRLFPKLKPICDDDVVRDHMNIWIDKYLEKNGRKYALKGHTDPPTVGYGGHIPKAVAANLSFGCTYQKGTMKSLSTFRSEILSHFARLNTPVETLKKEPERIIPQVFELSEQPISFRIFRNSGMVPNYAGHVHGQAFTEGKTQGDVTRKLEVCSHHYPSYGSYLRNKDLAEESCASDNA